MPDYPITKCPDPMYSPWTASGDGHGILPRTALGMLSEPSRRCHWEKLDGLISTEYDYANNPYIENLKLEVNPEGQSIMRKKLYETLMDEEVLKVLAEIPAFVQAMKKLKEAVSVL